MADSSQSEGKLKGSRKVERTGLNAWHRAVACSEFGFMSTGKGSLLQRGTSMERRPREFGGPAQQHVKNEARILREDQ